MKQTALITGASSGIGRDLAELIAADGHDVILTARSEGKLRALADELQSLYKIRAHVIPADLSRPDGAPKLFDAVQKLGLEVDFLINNAGSGQAGRFVDIDIAKDADVIQLDILSLVHLTKLFLPPMLARNRGRIMNLASTAAFQPGPLMAVYYAAKAFVLSFSEALAEEVRDSKVTITAVCPGPTATNFAESADMTERRLFKLTRPMSSMKVARIGYQGFLRGKRVVVTGIRNKMLAQSVRVTPRRVVTKVTRALQEKS